MSRRWLLWSLAVLITLGSLMVQRMTGPTYPFRGTVEINNQQYRYSLPRSHDQAKNCPVVLSIKDPQVHGLLSYRRLNAGEPWTTTPMVVTEEGLSGELPLQPTAGKLQYHIELEVNGQKQRVGGVENPIVIRFRHEVPVVIVLPHVLTLFLSFLFAIAAGLKAAFKQEGAKRLAWIGVIFFAIGGFLFGPLMQKFAFDVYWTGLPFGWDLTDNKTLIAMAFWIIALIMNHKEERPVWILLAVIVMLIVFMIPHSLLGSQLDYSTMKVKSG